MTYQDIKKYMILEGPTEAERRAYAVITYWVGFDDFWEKSAEYQNAIFQDLVRLEESWQ